MIVQKTFLILIGKLIFSCHYPSRKRKLYSKCLFFLLKNVSNSISDDVTDISDEAATEITDEENSTLELYVGKTFRNWIHVERFIKKYVSANGHGVRIGGGGRVNKATNEIVKRTYLCRHAGKAKPNQTNRTNASSC